MTEALRSCDLYMPSGSSDKECELALECVRVECLGVLQDPKGIMSFIVEVCTYAQS